MPDINEQADIDTSQISDQRSAGAPAGAGGGLPIPIPVGGGKIGLIITVIVVLATIVLGGGFGTGLLGGGDSGQTGDDTGLAQRCAKDNPERLKERDCRNALYVNSIQDYWQDALPQTFGKPYQLARTVFFAQGVSTGCGNADSGVGPFYCPPDKQIYIDLTFYDELANRFGAKGEFAQPYVLAHEYGHHVQTLLGTEAEMRRMQQRDPNNANALSVKLELQADCYAGAWAKNATKTTDAGGRPLFTSITEEDIAQAVQAAGQIGDDKIQEKSGTRVDESKFTHGSAAQRQEWFTRGFNTGDPKSCDTFGNA